MNDNYDEEFEDEEEYIEDDEYEQDYDLNNNYSRPPKTGKIGRDAVNNARSAVKTGVGRVASAFMAGLKNIFIAIMSNPYIAIIIVVICIIVALIWLALSDETTNKVISSVDDYILNSDTISQEALTLYNERHSLLLLKLSEINEMYDAFITDKKNPGDIKTAMKTVIGSNEVETKKATKYDTSESVVTVGGYDTKFKSGSDGVRDDERVKIITGSTNKISTYKKNGVYSLVDGYISTVKVEKVNVTVPVWTGSYGSQIASTTTIDVNVKLKDIVVAMFNDIYNDPSKPVINSVHSFRNNQNYPGHAFAVAIDINPDENPMKDRYGNMEDYKPGVDPLSMDENHPIVKIIRDKYGWDWGGDWSSSKDYMHFSFIGG